MSDKKSFTRKSKKIIKDTIENMKAIGTYKEEFTPVITRYSYMRLQFDMLMDRWLDDGGRVTEEYTNKNGATNERKTALYLSIETLRKELTDTEMILGLTPQGLKRINDKAIAAKRKSMLAEALKKIE